VIGCLVVIAVALMVPAKTAPDRRA
jgi:hypothetical protein